MEALERCADNEETKNNMWGELSKALNRTIHEVQLHAHQYFLRLQAETQGSAPKTSFMGPLDDGTWTKEEDVMFEHGVATFNEGDEERWAKIQKLLPSKTEDQIRKRYQKLLFDVSRIECGHQVVITFKPSKNKPSKDPPAPPPIFTPVAKEAFTAALATPNAATSQQQDKEIKTNEPNVADVKNDEVPPANKSESEAPQVVQETQEKEDEAKMDRTEETRETKDDANKEEPAQLALIENSMTDHTQEEDQTQTQDSDTSVPKSLEESAKKQEQEGNNIPSTIPMEVEEGGLGSDGAESKDENGPTKDNNPGGAELQQGNATTTLPKTAEELTVPAGNDA
uniref:Myb-like domain-containing protein n=1 Tax=Heterosigma akashiwo TaxID=2829 RepID=A0A7S4D6G4_HETAK|mmetsp:Transcript_34385/g.53794  ORF Transcript_34385/g.53794 Transcript_34385/m.53794 type:complete len:340 (-) Transcript_34385:271-1290(-)